MVRFSSHYYKVQ